MKVASKCVKQYTCQSGVLALPPKYAGKACQCTDPNCKKCEVSANGGEVCKSCRNSAFLYNGACHASCSEVDSSLIELGTSPFKRQCVEHPFTCANGKLVDAIDGTTPLDVKFGCTCPDETGLKADPNCDTCDFQAGRVAECKKCLNKTSLQNGACRPTD